MGGGWLPQDRAQRIGLIVSGTGHGLLVLWALMGGIFFTPDERPAIAATEVSLISSEDFAALQARAPTAATESPPQPSLPETAAPPPSPEAESQPDPDTSAPEETQPDPDATPDVEDLAPVETEVTDAPPVEVETPTPDSLSQIPDTATAKPQPKPAPTVAPVPSDDPVPDATIAETVEEQTTEAPAEEPVPEEVTEATAPQEAGEVLETEENQDLEVATAAPAQSPRPAKKPEKPSEPAPDEAAAAASETAPAAEEADAATEDAMEAALAEALSGEQSDEPAPGAGAADSGPPMTDGEKDALVVAVKQCWNVGSLSTDALRTVVTVAVSMGQDGKPDAGSIRMVGFEGGDETSARQAFEAGRRAIIRCAGEGYPLPADKYAQWQEIEIVFNPERMRLR